MRSRVLLSFGLFAVAAAFPSVASAEAATGSVDLQSAGPLAFSPDGVLFVADPKQAAIVAIETNDLSGSVEEANPQVTGLNKKLAALVGTTANDILINDIAVNPASGRVYVSLSRGRGPDAIPVLMTVGGDGELNEFPLDNVRYSSVRLPNAPADAITGQGRRRKNSRLESITDLTFLDGELFIAGLSNEEFASNLRSVKYPFESADVGTSIEIFHGAHGNYETRSPIRTFTSFGIDGDPHLLAAYTCTPLVKIPVSQLVSGDKVRGTTVAELGNRNRPLDMIVYQRDGQDFVLMANSSRGLMKISVDGINDIEGITERISGTSGLPYETVSSIEGVVQLDRLNKDHAVVLVDNSEGEISLATIALP